MDSRTNSPNIPGLGRPEPAQVWSARLRPPHERTPRPEPGHVVWYRHDAHGPLRRAQILAVLDDPQDPNTHRYVVDDPTLGPQTHPLTGERLREPVNDPWWTVRLRVDGMPGLVETREARIPGSPGWLPIDGGKS